MLIQSTNVFSLGDNFSWLASSFSNDYITAASGGQMPKLGWDNTTLLLKKSIVGPSKGQTLKTFSHFTWLAYCEKDIKEAGHHRSNNKDYELELKQKLWPTVAGIFPVTLCTIQ